MAPPAKRNRSYNRRPTKSSTAKKRPRGPGGKFQGREPVSLDLAPEDAAEAESDPVVDAGASQHEEPAVFATTTDLQVDHPDLDPILDDETLPRSPTEAAFLEPAGEATGDSCARDVVPNTLLAANGTFVWYALPPCLPPNWR